MELESFLICLCSKNIQKPLISLASKSADMAISWYLIDSNFFTILGSRRTLVAQKGRVNHGILKSKDTRGKIIIERHVSARIFLRAKQV